MKKRYAKPKTPYRRPPESRGVDALAKRELRRQYSKLNPAQLMGEIDSPQRKPFKTVIPGSIHPDEEAERDSAYVEWILL